MKTVRHQKLPEISVKARQQHSEPKRVAAVVSLVEYGQFNLKENRITCDNFV